PEQRQGSAVPSKLLIPRFARDDNARRVTRWNFTLLHVRNFAVNKRYLDVLVDIDLLGAKIDDLVRLADRGFHLIGGLPFFYLLRLRRGRLLLRLSSTSTALVVPLLIVAAALMPAAVIDGEESGDRIFYL